MILTGAIVNGMAVVVCGTLGVLLKKGMPARIGDAIMKGMALCVIYLGISGAMCGHNALIAILSVAVGAVLGELFNLDGLVVRLGNTLQARFGKSDSDGPSLADGFVTSSMLICAGAMAVVGSMESGLSANHSTLFAKSLIDAISCFIMGSTLGIGVPLSGVLCFAYEGLITVGAQFLSPLLTTVIIDEISCVGNLLLMAVGVNMLFPKTFKVMNYMPAIFLPILFCQFM